MSNQIKEKITKILAKKFYSSILNLHAKFCMLFVRRSSGIKVYFGGARTGEIGGTLVKIQRLKKYFNESTWDFSIVYLLSNAPYLPYGALQVFKDNKIPIVHNQNGVFYPGWYNGDYKKKNEKMSLSYHMADYVFYQSEFCKKCADLFLGTREGKGEILYNAIDVQLFRPKKNKYNGKIRILMTGKISYHLFYRIDNALKSFALARKKGLDCEFILAGWLDSQSKMLTEKLVQKLNISGSFRYLGPYDQVDAPAIYQNSDIYIMNKFKDPCPNTVIEAMSCGVPVLYINSGGVPELVGNDAGLAVEIGEHFDEWDSIINPSTENMSEAIIHMASRRDEMSSHARSRAVEKFNMDGWIKRHREIFNMLHQRV